MIIIMQDVQFVVHYSTNLLKEMITQIEKNQKRKKGGEGEE